jgi:sugar/nucleoside kinase (ribokinase family)
MSKKYDVLVIGELNVDILLNNIDDFPEIGKEKLARSMNTVLGSSSAIFASNLSSLGKRVAFLGKIGNDLYGNIILCSLDRSGVDISPIIKSDQYTTGATVVLNYGDDRAMITYPGAMEHLTADEVSSELLSQAGHVHFSSYFLQPGIKDGLGPLFKRARDLGLSTSLDPQWDPREEWDFNLAEVLPHVDVFLPNLMELLNISGEKNLNRAVVKLKDLVKQLVVKNGNKGSIGWTEGIMHEAKPFINNQVVDAIGAGDSFNAGYIKKFIEGHSLEACLKFGNLMGAISTTGTGGTGAFKDYQSIMELATGRFNYFG